MTPPESSGASVATWALSCLLCQSSIGVAREGDQFIDSVRPHLADAHGWLEPQVRELRYISISDRSRNLADRVFIGVGHQLVVDAVPDTWVP